MLARSGLPELTLHDFRHGYTTIAAAALPRLDHSPTVEEQIPWLAARLARWSFEVFWVQGVQQRETSNRATANG